MFEPFLESYTSVFTKGGRSVHLPFGGQDLALQRRKAPDSKTCFQSKGGRKPHFGSKATGACLGPHSRRLSFSSSLQQPPPSPSVFAAVKMSTEIMCMIPTQKLKVTSSTEINCKIPVHKLKVASRAQNTCFAPSLQPWERKIPKVASRARANANIKIAKAHKMRTTLAPAPL